MKKNFDKVMNDVRKVLRRRLTAKTHILTSDGENIVIIRGEMPLDEWPMIHELIKHIMLDEFNSQVLEEDWRTLFSWPE